MQDHTSVSSTSTVLQSASVQTTVSVISIFSTANIPLNRPLIPAVQYRGLIEIAYRISTVLTVIPIIMANGGLVMRNNFGASSGVLMASGTPIMHVLKASQMKQQRRVT